MQNFIEVKNGNPGFQGAWLKPENLGLTEALVPGDDRRMMSTE